MNNLLSNTGIILAEIAIIILWFCGVNWLIDKFYQQLVAISWLKKGENIAFSVI